MKGIARAVAALFFLGLAGCSAGQGQSDAEVKAAIQQQLDRCVKAVVTKDINLYMELIPEDFIIKDESGEIITREKQREYTLRNWSIIDTTLRDVFVVDSIRRYRPDSVIAYTSQQWERLMFQRDGKTKDTVLTTQKHRETWKKTKKGWLNYEVTELGGEIFLNGKRFKPN